MKTITNVEIKWSTHVFFFKPAKIPKPIPIGTDTTTEMILIYIEVGNLEKMMVVAG